MLKAYHRALASSKLDRRLDSQPVYAPLAKGARPITGKVIESRYLQTALSLTSPRSAAE